VPTGWWRRPVVCHTQLARGRLRRKPWAGRVALAEVVRTEEANLWIVDVGKGRHVVAREAQPMAAAVARSAVRHSLALDERVHRAISMPSKAYRTVRIQEVRGGPERVAVVEQQLRACRQLLIRQRPHGTDLRVHGDLAALLGMEDRRQ
jgi:hypothetical protein